MEVAEKADPFMRQLEATGDLNKTHEKRKPLTGSQKLKPGYSQQGGTSHLLSPTGGKVYAYGAPEFGNKPTQPGGVERALPQLTNPVPMNLPQIKATATQSRQGRWSEADVNPVTVTSINPYNSKVSLQNRGAQRLLHTAPTSRALAPNGQGGMSDQPVDFTHYVTSDHYKSMVPVAPVETDYAKNHPYQSPYMDPEGKKNSLQLHDEKLRERALQAAQAASQRRDQDEENRVTKATEQEEKLRANAPKEAQESSQRRNMAEDDRVAEMEQRMKQQEEGLRANALKEAMESSQRRDTAEESRVERESQQEEVLRARALEMAQESSQWRNMAEESRVAEMEQQEEGLRADTLRAAQESSQRRNTAEENRVATALQQEEDLRASALQEAISANRQHEALEENRTLAEIQPQENEEHNS
jgi:hypothetical protein